MAIDLRGLDKPNKVIGMTSALPNEGKSTLAIALARLISKGGGKVILVDGDLRNPVLSRLLTPVAETGVLEAILGKRNAKTRSGATPRPVGFSSRREFRPNRRRARSFRRRKPRRCSANCATRTIT